MRTPVLRLFDDREIVVDLFAGGGGTSLGIEWAIGRSPMVAVNHDPVAIAMHAANHPRTRHLVGNVWDVRPSDVADGRRVGLAWFSPDCCHHSKCKGGKPKSRRIRALAWVANRWAHEVKPRVIVVENVEEFRQWGPLDQEGYPITSKKGFTFKRWCQRIQAAGYRLDMQELRACDYGAPTTRKRLFVVARCDGGDIRWPEPTHGSVAQPYRTAAECIDWSIPCPSIFERTKPLAENTLRRIARGVQRYVVDAAQPFIAPLTHGRDAFRGRGIDEPFPTVTGANRGEFALVVPTLIQTGYGERPGQAPRVLSLEKPLGTVVAGGQKHALVSAFLAKHYGERATGGWNGGAEFSRPFGTVTVRDHHALVAAHLTSTTVTAERRHLGEVRALLLRHGGPMDRDPTLVTVGGEAYSIVDIGMRMLSPRELFRAQSFPDSYEIDVEYEGKRLSKTKQIKMAGNAVPPELAAAVVRANCTEGRRRRAV